MQLLQLVHGRFDRELRSPNTLAAVGELADAGYVDRHDAELLADAYRYLRTVEHRLQLVDEQQEHRLPTDALRPGSARPHRSATAASRHRSAVAQLTDDLRTHQSEVRSIHERIWFRPLLEAFSGGRRPLLTPEAAEARLAAFGFTDAARTRQAVAELTRGLTRSSRLMQQLLPLVFDWLSASPDPDLGLLGLRNLAAGPQRSMELANAFRDSPEAARRLCRHPRHQPPAGHDPAAQPAMISTLADADDLRLRSRRELVRGRRGVDAVARRRRRAARPRCKRFTDREGLRDRGPRRARPRRPRPRSGRRSPPWPRPRSRPPSTRSTPQLPFAVVGLGRFGGGELSYASDLDLVFVYDGASAGRLRGGRATGDGPGPLPVGGDTAVIYDIDAELRPEGRQGALARSLDGFRAYFERYAEPWERLAMVRARPVAGDAGARRRA